MIDLKPANWFKEVIHRRNKPFCTQSLSQRLQKKCSHFNHYKNCYWI